MTRWFTIALVLILVSKTAFSDDSYLLRKVDQKPLFWMGPYAGLNYNYHFADFSKIPPFPSCCPPQYGDGKGWGWTVGGLVNFAIAPNLSFGTRIGFSDISASFSKDENIGNTTILDKSGNTTRLKDTMVIVNHLVEAKLMMVNIEPTLDFKFFDNFVLNIGFKIGYMFTSRFNQREQIVSPENITFLNETTSQHVVSNEKIPESNTLQTFGVIGAGYELKIGRDLFLVPEIRYYIPFSNITTNIDVPWKASTFQFGASLRVPVFAPPPPKPVFRDSVINRDTVVIAKLGAMGAVEFLNADKNVEKIDKGDYFLISTTITEHYQKTIPKDAAFNVALTAYGVDKNNYRVNNPVILIEETEVEEGFPLLPHVFFKDGSADLKDAGMNLINSDQARSFDESKLKWNTLDIYADLLNIMGSRLKKKPSASIVITGCNNGMGVEKGNQKLSQDRANAIRDYLTSVWGVQFSQIKTKKQNLPTNPGKITEPEGIEENRRAELSSDNLDVIKWVKLKEIFRKSNPPVIKIIPSAVAEVGVKSWNLDIDQSGQNLRNFKGQAVPDSLLWYVEQEPMPRLDSDVKLQFTALDDFNQKRSADTSFVIKQKTIRVKREELKNDTLIERFSLILFDFDKADLTKLQMEALKEIKSSIKPNSKVTISGYADRTGEAEYNKDLALRRIQETQRTLQVPDNNLILNPVGSSELLYPNDKPQGRSYCRTVKIVIETPMNK